MLFGPVCLVVIPGGVFVDAFMAGLAIKSERVCPVPYFNNIFTGPESDLGRTLLDRICMALPA